MFNGIINKTEETVKPPVELIGGYKEGTFCYFYGTFGKVYCLSDVSGNVFYVGLTGHDLKKRLTQHISEAKNSTKKSKKSEKIISLNYDFYISIVEIEWVTGRNHREALSKIRHLETKCIDTYRALGYNLTNKSPKLYGNINVTEEYKGQCLAFINGVIKEITKNELK